MGFLFVEMMLWGASRGYHWFNLGMAPLSSQENQKLVPLWHRMGTLVVRFGDHFYNFQGLGAYKEKFGPVWQPRYPATPGGLSLPRTLADIGALISGGSRASCSNKKMIRENKQVEKPIVIFSLIIYRKRFILVPGFHLHRRIGKKADFLLKFKDSSKSPPFRGAGGVPNFMIN